MVNMTTFPPYNTVAADMLQANLQAEQLLQRVFYDHNPPSYRDLRAALKRLRESREAYLAQEQAVHRTTVLERSSA